MDCTEHDTLRVCGHVHVLTIPHVFFEFNIFQSGGVDSNNVILDKEILVMLRDRRRMANARICSMCFTGKQSRAFDMNTLKLSEFNHRSPSI